jgi:flagellar hook protein FlgE
MSFQQGLSGLNSSAKALDVVSNNIANANTIGFKTAEVHFSDVFAASLSGGGAAQGGIGAAVSGIVQQFSQGNLTTTSNPMDVSINGGGFYQMESPAKVETVSRNGQFHIDKEGYMINDQGLKLMGINADSKGQIPPGASQAVPIVLSADTLAPRATSDPVIASPQMGMTVNLNAASIVPATAFDPTKPDTYNYSTGMQVFDISGVAHQLNAYFVRSATTGTWDVYTGLADDLVASVPQTALAGSLTFDASGNGQLDPLVQTLVAPVANILLNQAATTWSPGDISFAGSTQYGSNSGVSSLVQNGYATGELTGFSISSKGVVQGSYSNGQVQDKAQIQLVNFRNPNALQSVGNNQWTYNADSGTPLPGFPGQGLYGALQSAAVEESNVDMTAELVKMITQQRNYQSNAQSIKTQDQIMQTLVNLR